MGSELENSTLTIGASRDNSDISRVVNRRNDTRCKDNLFPKPPIYLVLNHRQEIAMARRRNEPGFANVDHVNTVWTSLPQVGFHVHLQVLAAQVTLSCKQHLNILRGSIEDWRKISWRHDCGLDIWSAQDIDYSKLCRVGSLRISVRG